MNAKRLDACGFDTNVYISRLIGTGKPRAAAEAIRDIAEAVEPKRVLTDCIDPSDNRILEAAVEGHADCIVSGDKHLLRMNPFRSIEILNANDFLLRVGSPRSEAR